MHGEYHRDNKRAQSILPRNVISATNAPHAAARAVCNEPVAGLPPADGHDITGINIGRATGRVNAFPDRRPGRVLPPVIRPALSFRPAVPEFRRRFRREIDRQVHRTISRSEGRGEEGRRRLDRSENTARHCRAYRRSVSTAGDDIQDAEVPNSRAKKRRVNFGSPPLRRDIRPSDRFRQVIPEVFRLSLHRIARCKPLQECVLIPIRRIRSGICRS